MDMKVEILAAIGSITTHDSIKGEGFGAPQRLSESAKQKMEELLKHGAEAVPLVVTHARFLYGDMMSSLEMEKKVRKIPPPEKSGVFARIFGKKKPASPSLPEPEVSSWDRRAQVKASIYLLGRFCESENTRLPEAIELLTEFSQTRQRGVFDDSRAVLQNLGISKEDLWEKSLKSLPVVSKQPGDSPLKIAQVITALRNTSSFHIVERRVSGKHFSFGATYTHGHDFYRIAEEFWTRRVRTTD